MAGGASLVQNQQPASSTLRIAVVTETFPPEINGVAMTLGRLVGALRTRAHHVQLIRPRQDPLERPLQDERFEEILSGGFPIPRYQGLRMGLPARRVLTRLWRARPPDIVHIATEGPLGWSALSAANQLRLPVATGFHTNFHSYSKHYGLGFLKGLIALYLRDFHNKALATMVPTADLKGVLEARGYSNVQVVSRGVDARLFHPERRSRALRATWGAVDSDLVALYAGRLAPEKNLPLALRAFQAMRKEGRRHKLVWVGDGPERARMEREHADHIFAGMRTGEDLAMHYASADLFLFPSMTETFGNVTLEAMASGLAVVAYDYAAAAEHIEHGVSGLLAPFGDDDAFVCHAAAIAADSQRLPGLRHRARHTAERLDWESVYRRYEGVLEEVLRRRCAAIA